MFWDWSTQGCQVPTTIVTAKKSSKKDEIDDKNDNNEDESGGEEVWHYFYVFNLHIMSLGFKYEISIFSLTMTWKI
jgi:hypothetical protein